MTLPDESADQTVMPTSGLEDVLRKVAWRLLPIMMTLYVIAYLDRINISFAGLQMNADLHFDDATFGTGSGVFFFGYSLFGVPSNILLERFGARRLIAAMMIVWGLITVSMIHIQSAGEFYLLRFLLGVAEAGFFPGMILYLTYWFPKSRQGLVVGKFMSAIPVAGVLGGLVASVVLGAGEVRNVPLLQGLHGWQMLFVTTGLPAILSGFFVLFWLPDRPSAAAWLNSAESSTLSKAIAGEVVSLEQSSINKSRFVDVLSNRRIWFFCLLYFLMALGMYGFQLWLPQIIKDLGSLDASRTAMISAIPAVFQGAGMVLVARSSDKKQERKKHLAVSAVTAFVGLSSAALIHDPWLGLCALSIASFGIWGTVGPFWALPAAALSPAQRPPAIGLINSLGNLGGFVGPYAIGFIRSNHGQFSHGLVALACSLLCAALLVMQYKTDES